MAELDSKNESGNKDIIIPEKIDVSPEMSMYRILSSQNYDISFALAEFIDNAIQAFYDQQPITPTGEILEITLRFYSTDYHKSDLKNSIIIEDKGYGIDISSLTNAFQPATQQKQGGLSEFGIGMKSAAVWFANKWIVDTFPRELKKGLSFQFDLDELLKNKQNEVSLSNNDDIKQGTKITLCNLRKPIKDEQYKQICNDLTELYQLYTAGDDSFVSITAYFDDMLTELNYNYKTSETLVAEKYLTHNKTRYAVGSEKEWYVNIDFEYEDHDKNKSHITGFIKLLSEGSYTKNPGLILFRHKRVIQGLRKAPYVPIRLFQTSNKYASQRVYGQLHLDGLPVSFTKDKFNFIEDDFLNTLEKQPGLIELFKQACEYRKSDAIKISEKDFKSLQNNKPNNKQSKPKSNSKSSKQEKQEKSSSKNTKANNTEKSKSITTPDVLRQVNFLNHNISLVRTECIEVYNQNYILSASLCLRILLEKGLQSKIKQIDEAIYQQHRIGDKSITKLLKFLQDHKDDIVNDEQASKFIQATLSSETNSVVLINNIAHGHFNPSKDEFDKTVANLIPLFSWLSC
jgi:anti-sigma regulatory factor (Ser/Thr protein kinase)